MSELFPQPLMETLQKGLPLDQSVDWQAAIVQAREEAERAAAQQNTYAELFWRMRLAAMHAASQDMGASVLEFRHAMDLARALQIPGKEQVVDSLQVLLLTMVGMVESFTEPGAATAHLEEARAQLRAQGDTDMSGVAQACLGRAYAQLGKEDTALSMLDEIITNHPPGQQAHVTALIAKSETLADQGDYRSAAACLEQVIATGPGNELLQRMHYDLGRTLGKLDDDASARSHLEEAVSLAQQLELPREQVLALCELSRSCRALCDHPAAEQALLQALALLNEQRDGLLRAQVLGDLGVVRDEMGRSEEALAPMEEAWAWLSAHLDDPRARRRGVAIGGRLGLTYLRLQRNEEAQGMLDEAEALYQQDPDEPREVLMILLGQGLLKEFSGNDAEALKIYEHGLQLSLEQEIPIGEAMMLGRLASCSNDMGCLQQAQSHGERWLEVARQIGDRDTEAEALLCLGRVHANSGNKARGIALVQAAMVIWGEMGSSDVERAQELLGRWRAVS